MLLSCFNSLFLLNTPLTGIKCYLTTIEIAYYLYIPNN